MNKEFLLLHINRISEKLKSGKATNADYLEVKQLLGDFAPKSEFYKRITTPPGTKLGNIEIEISLSAWKSYIENDLYKQYSYQRIAQIETVNDFLEQAQSLLNENSIHPAAPAIIIGAALEEFLRNWLEEEGEDFTGKQKGINVYTNLLKGKNLIDKQDVKDLTAWAGLRNEAAHGNFESVSDRLRIKIMLEGVNLFTRKYSKAN